MNAISFFIFAPLKTNKITERMAAKNKAKAKTSRVIHKPKPSPITDNISPSPSPIFPPVILPRSIIPRPSIRPPNLLPKDKYLQNGMHIQRASPPRTTIHRLIFL